MIAQGLITLLGPETTLTIGAVLVLLIGALRSAALKSAVGVLALLAVVVAFLLSWYTSLHDYPVSISGLRLTNLTWYVRLAALGIGFIVLLVHWPLTAGPTLARGDAFAMILFSLTGILLTALADDLVLLFLAVELVSVPTYVLVSIGRSDIRSQEAGLKYFFLGALAAALLVYGFSFLYGAAGTTSISGMNLGGQLDSLTVLGLLLAFAGLSYKIAAVPFYAYVPDVYQGAASPITGLLGFFPKVAGFVALTKLILLLQPAARLTTGWDLPGAGFAFLWLAAAATMTVGNVLGLLQTNVKRILAYSSIAHSGYMLIGLLVGPVATGGPLPDGISALLFYIVVYGTMNLGAFAVLALIEVNGRPAEDLDDLAGLGRRQPAAALALAICIFSLIGMPPTAGFFAKLYVFSSALSAAPDNPHRAALVWLAVIGLINAAIGAAYYLRIIGACYLRDEEAPSALVPGRTALALGILCCCAFILLIGVWPQPLIAMARQSFFDLQPGG